MRKIALIFSVLLTIGVASSVCRAQSDSTKQVIAPRLLVGFSVPHTTFHGIKLEGLIPIASKLYLNISPEFYAGKLSNSDDGQLNGIGLHSGLRYAYWQHENKGDGIIAFAQSDLEFNYFRINKLDKRWVEKVQNGQQVMVLEEGEVYKRYNRFGMNYRMGGLWYFASGFYYEWSFGVALRKTISGFSDGYFPENKNDSYPWSYGYTGVTPLLGLRLGFLIR